MAIAGVATRNGRTAAFPPLETFAANNDERYTTGAFRPDADMRLTELEKVISVRHVDRLRAATPICGWTAASS